MFFFCTFVFILCFGYLYTYLYYYLLLDQSPEWRSPGWNRQLRTMYKWRDLIQTFKKLVKRKRESYLHQCYDWIFFMALPLFISVFISTYSKNNQNNDQNASLSLPGLLFFPIAYCGCHWHPNASVKQIRDLIISNIFHLLLEYLVNAHSYRMHIVCLEF